MRSPCVRRGPAGTTVTATLEAQVAKLASDLEKAAVEAVGRRVLRLADVTPVQSVAALLVKVK